MTDIVKYKMLQCIEPAKNHHKFYEIKMEEIDGEYAVFARYGRIGSEGKLVEKYMGPSYHLAEQIMDDIYNEKIKKYEDVS